MASEILYRLSNVKHNLLHNFRTPLWYILSIIVAGILSLSIYLMFPPAKESYLFYFPNGDAVQAEVHRIPVSRSNQEETVKNYIHELILGPIDIKLDLLFPRNTEIKTIMLRNDIVYVDIDSSIFILNDALQRPLSESLKLFRQNILGSFQFINNVIILIDGVEVR